MKRAAALGLSFTALHAGRSNTVLAGEAGKVRWVSPRGTLDVLDDYPYWVAKKMGYFGDIETTLEPGPTAGQGKLVDADQADMGYPSPGVYSFESRAGSPARLGLRDGRLRRIRLCLPEGKAPESPISRSWKARRSLLGDGRWQGICDPKFAQMGADLTKIEYLGRRSPSWQEHLKRRVRPMPRSRGRVCAPSGSAHRSMTSTTCSVWSTRSSRPIRS